MIKPQHLLAIFGAVVACGPEGPEKIDLLFGTYSSPTAGISNQNSTTVTHYEIRADGTFVIGGFYGCGASKATMKEYTWVRHGEAAIDVLFPDASEGGIDTWRITRGVDCNQIHVERRREGESVGDRDYQRGEVCLDVLPPCPGTQCDSCKTVWCDGPPPPCDEAAP